EREDDGDPARARGPGNRRELEAARPPRHEEREEDAEQERDSGDERDVVALADVREDLGGIEDVVEGDVVVAGVELLEEVVLRRRVEEERGEGERQEGGAEESVREE